MSTTAAAPQSEAQDSPSVFGCWKSPMVCGFGVGLVGSRCFSAWLPFVMRMSGDEVDPDMAPATEGLDVRCEACQSALTEMSRDAVSFLLVDDLRIPLLGCDMHLEMFRARCGLTSAETARLLTHRPAGGLACPGCQNAPQTTTQTMLPVQDGALALLACPQHQAAVTHRFHTGLHTHTQLTTPLTTHTP